MSPEGVRVEAVSTGWVDAGVVDGKEHELVPAVSFTLKNVSDQKLPALQVNAVFRRVERGPEGWGDGFRKTWRDWLASRRAPPPCH